MVQYKLHYFDGRGLGEPIRLLLHYKAEPFEDIRFTQDKWPDMKSKYFYGKVPVLEVGGKQLAQSAAILRYLANKYDLAGKNEWEKAKVDEIMDFYKDTASELVPYLYVKMGYREGNLEQLRRDVFVPGVQQRFPLYVKLLAESGSGFFAPSGLTFVDFAIADYFRTIQIAEPELLKEYPELVKHLEKVYALTELKQYLSTRKE